MSIQKATILCIVGITWDNVDFENRLIHIRQSVVTGDSSILPKGTYKVIGEVGGRRKREIILKTMLKTDSSVRSFTMNDALYNYLKTLKAEQEVMIRETNAYKDFVCVNAVGTLILPDSITHYFTKLLDKNDLPHIKFHALRHSCISLLANNTAFTMKQIQDYAGHGDFLTTFNVYSLPMILQRRLKWTISQAASPICSATAMKNKQRAGVPISGAPAFVN